MSLASESAEEEETRLSRRRGRDRPRRAAQFRRRRKIVAALKLPRPESVETEIEHRSVSILKARRRRRHKQMISLIQTALSHHSCIILQRRACIAEYVASYISYRVGASLHVHVSTTCFIHHAAYFIPHVHVPTITCLLLRTCL